MPRGKVKQRKPVRTRKPPVVKPIRATASKAPRIKKNKSLPVVTSEIWDGQTIEEDFVESEQDGAEEEFLPPGYAPPHVPSGSAVLESVVAPVAQAQGTSPELMKALNILLPPMPPAAKPSSLPPMPVARPALASSVLASNAAFAIPAGHVVAQHRNTLTEEQANKLIVGKQMLAIEMIARCTVDLVDLNIRTRNNMPTTATGSIIVGLKRAIFYLEHPLVEKMPDFELDPKNYNNTGT